MGIFFAIGAYILWGLLPLYWKALNNVSAIEILCHRIFWSFVFLSILMAYQHHWRDFKKRISSRTILLTFTASGLILGCNWFLYIWSVNNGHLIEASLGYFINPLVTVLLGILFFHEKLTTKQWLAIALAAAGVLYITLQFGDFPWIALILAFSFSAYGLLKKKGTLGTGEGLTFETMVLLIPAAVFLASLQVKGTAAFLHGNLMQNLLLFFAGVVTTVPLLFFTAAAHRISLSTLGLLQYISPTLQFSLGVFVFHETFSRQRLIGFLFIWIALAIFMIETLKYKYLKSTDTSEVAIT